MVFRRARSPAALQALLVALKKTYGYCKAYELYTGGGGDGDLPPNDYDRTLDETTILDLIGRRMKHLRNGRAQIGNITEREYYVWTYDREYGIFALIDKQ